MSDPEPNRFGADVALVERVVAGDTKAAEALTHRMTKAFWRRARRMRTRAPWLQSHEADLLQRFQLRLIENDFRYLRSYAGTGPLDGWLGVIAVRFLQRQAGVLAPRQTVSIEDSAEVVDGAESAERRLVRRDEIDTVRRVVSTLPDADQAMLALLYEQDAPAHAVGEILGLTASGVRMKKARLLQKLTKKLRSLAPENRRDSTPRGAPQ